MSISKTTSKINELNQEAMKKAQNHLNSLTKPKNSLGRLEDLCVKVAGIQGKEPEINNKKIFILAGDHGITEEGVSAFPSPVTKQMMKNFVNGGAAINALSNYSKADLELVDIGVNGKIESDKIIDKKISNGTNNFYKEPVMTKKQAKKSIKHGINLVKEHAGKSEVIGLGEMGIGNTTPSAAIFSTILNLKPEEIIGTGTGLDDKGIQNKIDVVTESLKRRKPSKEPIEILSKVGGFEIGGLTGVIIEAAAENKVIIVDGYITLSAALLAVEIEPKVENYLIFGHSSGENGFERIINEKDFDPLLDLDMKLGEGTGASLAMNILESSVKTYHEMATFEESGVSGS